MGGPRTHGSTASTAPGTRHATSGWRWTASEGRAPGDAAGAVPGAWRTARQTAHPMVRS